VKYLKKVENNGILSLFLGSAYLLKIRQKLSKIVGFNTHEVSLLVRFLTFPAIFTFIRKLPSFLSTKGARTQKGFADS
jgi:hypothetical protein